MSQLIANNLLNMVNTANCTSQKKSNCSTIETNQNLVIGNCNITIDIKNVHAETANISVASGKQETAGEFSLTSLTDTHSTVKESLSSTLSN